MSTLLILILVVFLAFPYSARSQSRVFRPSRHARFAAPANTVRSTSGVSSRSFSLERQRQAFRSRSQQSSYRGTNKQASVGPPRPKLSLGRNGPNYFRGSRQRGAAPLTGSGLRAPLSNEEMRSSSRGPGWSSFKDASGEQGNKVQRFFSNQRRDAVIDEDDFER